MLRHYLTWLFWPNSVKETKEKPPLIQAVISNDLETAKSLIRKKENIDITDTKGKTALFYALKMEQAVLISKLLKYGANPNLFIDDKTSLMYAIQTGKNIATEALLGFRVCYKNLNLQNKEGKTALWFALDNDDTETVSHLLRLKANLHFLNNPATRKEDHCNVLMLAIAGNEYLKDRKKLLKTVLELKADINIKNKKNGSTALILAISHRSYLTHRGDHDLFYSRDNKDVEMLIKYKADLNIKDTLGKTALMCAAEQANPSIVKKLLENKAEIESGDSKESALNCAILPLKKKYTADYEKVEIIETLLEHKAAMNRVHSDLYPLLILLATEMSSKKILKSLFENKVDINCVLPSNRQGVTALIFASQRGLIASIKMLLENKANINHQDEYGQTALYLGSTHKDFTEREDSHRMALFNLLLDRNADVNLSPSMGSLSLLGSMAHAGIQGFLRLKKLCEHKADINYQDKDGDTALFEIFHLGLSNDQKEKATRVLLECNSLVDIQNKHGETPLTLAARLGSKDIVNMMQEAKKQQQLRNYRTLLAFGMYLGDSKKQDGQKNESPLKQLASHYLFSNDVIKHTLFSFIDPNDVPEKKCKTLREELGFDKIYQEEMKHIRTFFYGQPHHQVRNQLKEIYHMANEILEQTDKLTFINEIPMTPLFNLKKKIAETQVLLDAEELHLSEQEKNIWLKKLGNINAYVNHILLQIEQQPDENQSSVNRRMSLG